LESAALMSKLRRFTVVATHQHARVVIAPSAFLGPGFSLMIPDHGELTIGEHVSFRRGFVCEIGGSGHVTIGDRTVFTVDGLIQCSTSVEIEPDCVFAQGVLIVDGSHRFRDPDVPMLEQGYDFRPVRIGRGAAIMAKCSVIGADVGRRAFVGANSVVTHDIPPYCLAVGAPARVVEYFGPPELRPEGLSRRA
jgi:acetyltransferase-like isoleucine patch superfamily enzyme